MVICSLVTAQTADTTLTLACKGTQTSGEGARARPEPVNMGIIVDLQKKTVVGLEPTTPLTIDDVTETIVSFVGQEELSPNLGDGRDQAAAI
jgi:hypothetical protein